MVVMAGPGLLKVWLKFLKAVKGDFDGNRTQELKPNALLTPVKLMKTVPCFEKIYI